MLAAELAIGALALRQPLTFIVAGLVMVAGLLAVGRIRIRLEPGTPDPADADAPAAGAGAPPAGVGSTAAGARATTTAAGAATAVLRVDDANLPVTAIAAVTPIGPAERRDLLGVDADPLAFVIQRPWIGGGVRIDLADPDDPTPYWFVSSRQPDRLAAAIEAARVRAGDAPERPLSSD